MVGSDMESCVSLCQLFETSEISFEIDLLPNKKGLDKPTPKNISELDGGGPATQCFSRAVMPAKAHQYVGTTATDKPANQNI